MGTITVSVDNKVEKEFREEVKRALGKQKDSLSKATTEAFKKWAFEKKQQEIAHREIDLLKKGFGMGKIKFKREELHER